MSDTFMLVGEMYGDCPIDDRPGIAWGGVGRDACGCVMLHGGDRLSARSQESWRITEASNVRHRHDMRPLAARGPRKDTV